MDFEKDQTYEDKCAYANFIERIDMLNREAWDNKTSDPELSFNYSKEALALSETLSYQPGIARGILGIGRYYSGNDRYDLSNMHLYEALEKFINMTDIDGQIKAHNILNSNYCSTGNFAEALAHALKAYLMAKEIGHAMLSILLNNIGNLHMEMGKYEEAMGYLQESQNLRDADRENYISCFSVLNISQCHLKLGNIEAAKHYCELAYTMAEEHKANHEIVRVLKTFGTIFIEENSPDKALITLKEARILNAECSFKLRIDTEILRYIAKAYRDLDLKDEAISSLQEAAIIASEITSDKILLNIKLELAHIYEEASDYVNTIEHYKEYIKLRDKTSSDDYKRRVDFLSAEFKLEKAKHEAEIFKLKNIELKEKNEIIEKKATELEASNIIINKVSEIGKLITASLEVEKILNTAYEIFNSLIDMTTFGIGIYDEKEGIINFKMFIENNERLPEYEKSIEDKGSFAAWCIRNKKEVIIGDAEMEYGKYVEKRSPMCNPKELTLNNSIIFYPLIVEDSVIGMVTFQSKKKNAYSEQQLDIMSALVSYIAIALNNSNKSEELKKIAKELKDTIENLQEAQKQLASAKDAAEASTRAKSQFLATMSHEIRTPMNAIIGFSNLGLKARNPSKIYDSLTKINISANSLLGIINDILDFSKIEAGKLKMESVVFDIDNVINNIVDIISVKAAQKNIDLYCSIAKDLPRSLIGDPLRFGQVITNLAENSVKFTERGNVLIKVKKLEENDTYCKLEVTVEDSGIGMTKAQMETIFFAFSQADTSITRKFGGTGLGLAISKYFVDMMNGEMLVESELGKGSIFSFTAEFLKQSIGTSKNAIEVCKKESFSLPSAHDVEIIQEILGIRILLVEDITYNQEIVSELLKEAGVIVEITNNGRDAVTAIEDTYFDLILMDIQMPEMDGYEATRIIRKNIKNKNLPIIAMTAHVMEEARNECFEAGMNDFITKPINTAELFKIILKWVKQTSSSKLEILELMQIKEDLNKEDIELPENLPGINVKEALERMKNNRKILKKFICDFAENYGLVINELISANMNGDMETHKRLVHNLKSVAGIVSANDVYRLACILEEDIKNNRRDFDKNIDQLKTAFDEIVKSSELLKTMGDSK